MNTIPEPGDLALVVKCGIPENVNRVVLVDSRVQPGERIRIDGMDHMSSGAQMCYLVWAQGAPLAVPVYYRHLGEFRSELSRAALVLPAHLRKLGGDDQGDDETLHWLPVPKRENMSPKPQYVGYPEKQR